MNALQASAASALALAAAACAPAHPPVARGALACPATRGQLSRISVAPDHRSCVYTTGDGDEVTLQLVAVTGGPEATLAPVRNALETQFAPAADSATAKSSSAATAGATDKDDDEDGDSLNGAGGHADVDLPGIHINAHDDGAKVDVGSIHVDGSQSGGIVEVSRNVRMRGESLALEKRGFRATFILSGDRLKAGYKMVGYEAAGPRAGPLAVAVVKSREGKHHNLFADTQRLVRDNGGV